MNSFDYLQQLGMFSCDLGLERMRRLYELLGAPAPRLGYLHLAGTNGKGSVGALLESALRTAGFRTGFYSSPHLIEPTERVRINGRALTSERWEAAGQRVMAAAETLRAAGGGQVTYFEFTTALAALVFAEEAVDFGCWETGMGGRLDATNVVTPRLSIITGIALDHQTYLGDTLAAIAGEKAGIIKPGVPVLAGAMPEEALRVIAERARELGSPLLRPLPTGAAEYRRGHQFFTLDGEPVELALIGPMQRRNAALAGAALRELARDGAFDRARALSGWRRVRWPGRIQMLNDLVIDGGHNPDGLTALAEALREAFPGEHFRVIFGAFQDKDAASGLPLLAPLAEEFIFTPVPAAGRACYSAAELRAMVPPTCPTRAAADFEEALRLARAAGGRTLVSGSLYLAGAVLAAAGATEQVLNLD